MMSPVLRFLRSKAGSFVAGVLTGLVGNFLYDMKKDDALTWYRHHVTYGVFHKKEFDRYVLGAELYEKAEGADKNGERAAAAAMYKEAVQALTEADAADIFEASFYLGILYCHGRSGYIQPRPAMGKILISKAASGGIEKAKAFTSESCLSADQGQAVSR